MSTLIVDARVQDIARRLLPEAVQIKVLDLSKQDAALDYPVNSSVLGAICPAGEQQVLRRALSDGPFSKIQIFEVTATSLTRAGIC